jgi:hypothetical protein
MNTKFTNIPTEEIRRNAQKWFESPEGRQTILSALQESKNITARLQEERRVDAKSLHEPFTV